MTPIPIYIYDMIYFSKHPYTKIRLICRKNKCIHILIYVLLIYNYIYYCICDYIVNMYVYI